MLKLYLFYVFESQTSTTGNVAPLRPSSPTTMSTTPSLFVTPTSQPALQQSLATSAIASSIAQVFPGAQTVSMLQNGQLQQFLVVSPTQLSPTQLSQLAGTQLLIPNQVD